MTDQDFGFGPLSQNATTERPVEVDSDSHAKQTWFRDASGPGKKDGTVINASWLNHIVGNLSTICKNAGVPFSNSHGSDHFLYDAVLGLIKRIIDFGKPKEGQTLRLVEGRFIPVDPRLDDLFDVSFSDPKDGDVLEFSDGKWRAAPVGTIDGTATTTQLADETAARIAGDSAEITARTSAVAAEATARANADTAEATARANADTAEATTRSNADTALQDNINTVSSAAAAAQATATAALPKADVVNDLVTSSASKALSAQQGVALKGLIDAVATGSLSASALAAAPFGPFTNIAGSATTDLGSVASVGVTITGSGASIASFGTTGASLLRIGKMGGAHTLVHGAALNLPGAVNILTAAGDRFIALSDASDNWTIIEYVCADGTPLVIPTQAEAEAGTQNTKPMTALRTKQAITLQVPLLATAKWLGSNKTISTAAPSGGVDGDIWFQREA